MTITFYFLLTHCIFQLTRSRGAWLNNSVIPITNNWFQLTRSRGAWHLQSDTFHNDLVISTHTLTWSVTREWFMETDQWSISTHTLTWSVTGHVIFSFCGFFISTHTLTWSVTLFLFLFVLCTQFQLTRSRGAWPVKILWQQGNIWFQLTRSRGAWHRAWIYKKW